MWKGKFTEVRAKFDRFWADEVMPNEEKYFEQVRKNRADGRAWDRVPIIGELSAKARAANLTNLFLPSESGLTQYEYAQFAETMGRAPWATQVFNCDAPDTGNMETLHLYGNQAQQDKWLGPLLRQEIRSCIAMTEPAVASSDATNIATTARRDGDEYVINGRKWWITGFGHPDTKILLAIVNTSDEGKPHRRHSIILIPKDTPGVRGVRPLQVFNEDDAPIGHWEIEFKDVRVPVENRLRGEGDGFAMAQGRLGPGRVHHCMRSIGMAERALEMMVARAAQRTAFRKRLAKNAVVQHQIAESRIDIDTARHLVLHVAKQLDTVGSKAAMQQIAMIKVVAPRAACRVIDRAIQVHGGMGLSQDSMLPLFYGGQRSLRIADGPDDVHLMTVGKLELKRQLAKSGL
jgi:alkylation response protein AidB-like acyl-CoA dehydrogenase